MHVSTILQDGAAIVAILGFGYAIAAMLNRKFQRRIEAAIQELNKNATPNGKDSLAVGDTAARIEDKLDFYGQLLIGHITHHPGPTIYSPPPLADVPTTRAEIEEERAE